MDKALKLNDYLYILDGHEVKPVPDSGAAGVLEWAMALEGGERSVGDTNIGPVRVSTVFIGIDTNRTVPPRVFETAIFGGPDGVDVVQKYSTWDDALKGHRKYVARARQKARLIRARRKAK